MWTHSKGVINRRVSLEAEATQRGVTLKTQWLLAIRFQYTESCKREEESLRNWAKLIYWYWETFLGLTMPNKLPQIMYIFTVECFKYNGEILTKYKIIKSVVNAC